MSVLVDTSVWVDHFRRRNKILVALLAQDQAMSHPMVVVELACGTPPEPRSQRSTTSVCCKPAARPPGTRSAPSSSGNGCTARAAVWGPVLADIDPDHAGHTLVDTRQAPCRPRGTLRRPVAIHGAPLKIGLMSGTDPRLTRGGRYRSCACARHRGLASHHRQTARVRPLHQRGRRELGADR